MFLKYLVFLTVFLGVSDAGTVPNSDYVEVGPKRFYLKTVGMMNFFGAHHYCRLHGMNLASVDAKEEHQKLGKYIEDFDLEDQGYWIGGNNLPDNTWVWMSSGKPVSFTAWSKGEPNNTGGNENCMEFWVKSSDGTYVWNDHYCNRRKYFICEKYEKDLEIIPRYN